LTATATWTGTTYFDDSVPPNELSNRTIGVAMPTVATSWSERRVVAPERYDHGLRLLEL
jgi:hypothetical protein